MPHVLGMMSLAKPLNVPMSSSVSGFCVPDTSSKGDKVLSLELRFFPGVNLSCKEMIRKYKRTVRWDSLNRSYEQFLCSHLLIDVTYFKTSPQANYVYEKRVVHD